MHEALTLGLVWAAGVLLGVLFFGGLWWTVRKSLSSGQPAVWLLGSLLVRMSMAVTGLYFVSDQHWERMLVCLLGLVMARPAVTWLTRNAHEHLAPVVQQEAHRAS